MTPVRKKRKSSGLAGVGNEQGNHSKDEAQSNPLSSLLNHKPAASRAPKKDDNLRSDRNGVGSTSIPVNGAPKDLSTEEMVIAAIIALKDDSATASAIQQWILKRYESVSKDMLKNVNSKLKSMVGEKKLVKDKGKQTYKLHGVVAKSRDQHVLPPKKAKVSQSQHRQAVKKIPLTMSAAEAAEVAARAVAEAEAAALAAQAAAAEAEALEQEANDAKIREKEAEMQQQQQRRNAV